MSLNFDYLLKKTKISILISFFPVFVQYLQLHHTITYLVLKPELSVTVCLYPSIMLKIADFLSMP